MTPDRLKNILDGFSGVTIAVIGDLMMDEYVWGEVSRISPDAPVQVVEIRRRSQAIGGAGNVAHNILAAGGAADLYSATGTDRAGRELLVLLERAGVGTHGIRAEERRVTTVKTRVVARGQHLVRLDEEVKGSLGARDRASLLQAFTSKVKSYRAVLVSDYDKGVVDATLVGELAEIVRRENPEIPIIVDPKRADLSGYRGCTAITPNQREVETAVRMSLRSDADLQQAAVRIREACGSRWVLMTRGEKGMALSGPDGGLVLIPAHAREVYDVTGAGDTVLAFFGLALATSVPADEAAQIANLAAGVKIAKVGTAAVGPSEVIAWYAGGRGPGKIMGASEASARVEYERSRGKRIVFTNGCFDLLHAGHVHLLEQARAKGDLLVVGLNNDDSVRRLKGEGRPLMNVEDRARLLAALDAVDFVLVFEDDTPLAAIEHVRPDVLVKGGDYSIDTIVGHELVLGYGGRVETIPIVGGRSTSQIIEAIKKTGES